VKLQLYYDPSQDADFQVKKFALKLCVWTEIQRNAIPVRLLLARDVASAIFIWRTNSLEQSLSLIVSLADQQIPCHFWNPKVHYCVYKIPLLDTILCQLSLVRAFGHCFFKIYFRNALQYMPSYPKCAAVFSHETYCSREFVQINFLWKAV